VHAVASGVPPPSGTRPTPGATAPDAVAAKTGRGATAPVVPAVPPKADETAPPVSFDDVRALVSDADNKGLERHALLRIGDGRVSLLDRNGGASIASLAYADGLGAFYSRSKQPKWRDGNGKQVESEVDLGRMGFFRGERNWLVLLTAGEPVIIRLEDADLQKVLPALQERTGVQIKR
jgi:hypothetical protein